MPANLLQQLREMTVVVADTGDIEAIEKFTPRDATTNPSLITAAAQMPQYQGIVDSTLKQARADSGASGMGAAAAGRAPAPSVTCPITAVAATDVSSVLRLSCGPMSTPSSGQCFAPQ